MWDLAKDKNSIENVTGFTDGEEHEREDVAQGR
jgi:hypothetical protein